MEIVVAYSFQRTVTDLKHLVQVVGSGWDDLLPFLLVERSWGLFFILYLQFWVVRFTCFDSGTVFKGGMYARETQQVAGA